MKELNINFVYIIIFLRNGGERLRAIWLAKNYFDIDLIEAKRWVETVSLKKRTELTGVNWNLEILPMHLADTKEVSHWPPTIERMLKYGESIVKCYRPSNPEGLQDEAWLAGMSPLPGIPDAIID